MKLVRWGAAGAEKPGLVDAEGHVRDLSGVVADSVRFCFELCAAGTPLAGARLDIVESPGLGRCRDCAGQVELTDLIALCDCGSANLEITSGQQLKIKAIEMEA